MHRTLLAITCLALTACATVRGRADDALAQGKFQEAADLYDAVVQRDPSDTDARRLRDEARARALGVIVDGARADRFMHRDAEASAQVDRLLDLADRWGDVPLDATLQAQLAAEIDATASYEAGKVRATLPAAPLVATDKLATTKVLRHKALAKTRDALALEIDHAGREACQRHAASVTPDQPYWSYVVATYCAEWKGRLAVEPVLPDTRSGVLLDAKIAGASEREVAALGADVARWFSRTRWYAPNAARPAVATLRGTLHVGFEHRQVSLTAPWVESVPYTVSESYQEPYQEPYSDTEYYSEQVPYTTYQSVSTPCGTTTCTESRPVTQYRSEQRSRTVTKYRTAYRSATRIVTRYRDEPRVFQYEADEVSGAYAARLALSLPVRDAAAPLAVQAEAQLERSGIAHDVTFEAAGVHPQGAGLPSRAAFLADEASELENRFYAALANAWSEAFCGQPTFTRNEAARCLYGNAEPPPPAMLALRQVLGDDALRMVSRIHR